MKAWWRVLRGVNPYSWMVMVSMICALGVGLSYASGVAVMLPVMKVFMSAEGLQGWTNRTAAQSRLGLDLWDLDASSALARKAELRISEVTSQASTTLTDKLRDP